jgi:hypothetical protein
MCTSTLSGEVFLIFSFNIVIATDSVIMDASMTCSWCVSRCCLLAGFTCVEGTVPFKMGRIATFETLILSMGVISSICG